MTPLFVCKGKIRYNEILINRAAARLPRPLCMNKFIDSLEGGVVIRFAHNHVRK